MTPADHYREADRVLRELKTSGVVPVSEALYTVAYAQAHATLAQTPSDTYLEATGRL